MKVLIGIDEITRAQELAEACLKKWVLVSNLCNT
jgi:hypothetical protein